MADMTTRKSKTEVPTLVDLDGPQAERRLDAETFVHAAFERAYGAHVQHFMPTLMSLRNDDDTLLAVLGLRIVDRQPLFLEQYLDRPVEQALSAAAGLPVDRASLVEVGNFAVGAIGGGRWLITALTAYLFGTGHTWAVFTCGPELRNAFRRLGVELVDIAPADPGRLSPQECACWGRYYEQRPRVMAASVAQSYAVLSALFEKECALNSLWTRAQLAGRNVA
ncbi:thermostable hemolysin [Thiosocius teredinicola]|uniref:thermostable hemolysin n=1 Tax=Thiosocius teredinicola TaxID=1973002 RepID=UPI000991456F